VLRAGGQPEAEMPPCLADLLGAEIGADQRQGRVGIAGCELHPAGGQRPRQRVLPAGQRYGGGVRSELRLGQLLHRLLVTRGRNTAVAALQGGLRADDRGITVRGAVGGRGSGARDRGAAQGGREQCGQAGEHGHP